MTTTGWDYAKAQADPDTPESTRRVGHVALDDDDARPPHAPTMLDSGVHCAHDVRTPTHLHFRVSDRDGAVHLQITSLIPT